MFIYGEMCGGTHRQRNIMTPLGQIGWLQLATRGPDRSRSVTNNIKREAHHADVGKM